MRALELGTNVIIDFGLRSRDERSALRKAAADIGAAVVMCHFELTPAEQRKRLDQRLAEAPHDTWPISERELAAWLPGSTSRRRRSSTRANPSAPPLWFRHLARVDRTSLAAVRGEWRTRPNTKESPGSAAACPTRRNGKVTTTQSRT